MDNTDPVVTKHIFVTGGVVSSLGKGLTAASLGNLLTARGLRVVMQKLDPYLNVDPGTMNPFQHGEVFVTDDGAETDLDIGHYERFLDIDLTKAANVTTGQIYSTVIARERRGEYLGDTVQVIPHITDEIKRRMRLQALDDPRPDVIITEIGGTVGDIESQPFIESASQVRHELGRKNVFFVHVSLVPYMGASGEQKTKPTQHSVAALRSIGIQPDALVLRSDRPVSDANRRKIALMCDVDLEAVVNAVDVPSIYDIPTMLHDQGLDAYIIDQLGLPAGDVNWDGWRELLETVHAPKHEVTIGLVGKYIDLPDAYLSVTEALKAGGFANQTKVAIRWIPSDECQTPEGAARHLSDLDGMLVPGGFGVRGIEGKLGALKFARENGIPTLGLCLGLQCMVIEYARDVVGLAGASSSEFDPDTEYPVIATMAEQVDILADGDMGGTMRLGLYEAELTPGSIAAEVYGSNRVSERHRHRYEVNNAYRGQLEAAGIVFSGLSPGPEPRRVRRAAARGASVLHRHPGPPRAAIAAEPRPSAVQGPHRRRARAPAGEPPVRGTGRGRRRSRACRGAGHERRCRHSVTNVPMPPLRDEPYEPELISSDVVLDGAVWDVRRDRFRLDDGELVREYVDHPGAVAVLAMDERDRVLLIQQYRHPVRQRDWELPAGLLDVTGESPLLAAKRELAEEADLVAEDWALLSEFMTSPGGSNEVLRVYLARGITAAPETFDRTAEEAGIVERWVPLDEAVDAVLARELQNAIVAIAVLSARAARDRGWTALADAETPWLKHPRLS